MDEIWSYLKRKRRQLKAKADGKEISGLAYVLERAGAKAVIARLWNAENLKSF